MYPPKFLFFGANARNTTQLQLGAEVRDNRLEFTKSGFSAVFDLVTELAVRPTDLVTEQCPSGEKEQLALLREIKSFMYEKHPQETSR